MYIITYKPSKALAIIDSYEKQYLNKTPTKQNSPSNDTQTTTTTDTIDDKCLISIFKLRLYSQFKLNLYNDELQSLSINKNVSIS